MTLVHFELLAQIRHFRVISGTVVKFGGFLSRVTFNVENYFRNRNISSGTIEVCKEMDHGRNGMYYFQV